MIRGAWLPLAAAALPIAAAAAPSVDRRVSLELARQLEADGLLREAARERRRAAGIEGLSTPPPREQASAKPIQRIGAVRPAGGLVRGIVSVYRTFIRPAIGARCSLSPSCSEYFRQAGARHGLLAFPIMADRLVREPSVTASGQPSRGHGGRVPDPLSDHDFWLSSSPRFRR